MTFLTLVRLSIILLVMRFLNFISSIRRFTLVVDLTLSDIIIMLYASTGRSHILVTCLSRLIGIFVSLSIKSILSVTVFVIRVCQFLSIFSVLSFPSSCFLACRDSPLIIDLSYFCLCLFWAVCIRLFPTCRWPSFCHLIWGRPLPLLVSRCLHYMTIFDHCVLSLAICFAYCHLLLAFCATTSIRFVQFFQFLFSH